MPGRALIDPQGVTRNIIVVSDDTGGSDYPLEPGWRLDDPDLFPMPVLPTPVPTPVTPRQMKLAMLQQGMLDNVITFVNAQSRAVQISWNATTQFDRADPMLNEMAGAFGMTQGQVDDLFRNASTL